MIQEHDRPRANSAPSVAALSTRGHGHVHYPLILNRPRHLDGLFSDEDSSKTELKGVHNGYASQGGTRPFIPTRGSLGGSGNTRINTRGPSSRHNQRRGTLGRALSISQEQKEKIELKCCRINVLLVTMQLFLGAIVSTLAFYMETLTPTLRIRECPYWAGLPLLLAGVFGIYYCATDFATYSRSTRAFIIKCSSLTLCTSCIFLCMIGSVFTGILGNKIASFVNCNMTDTRCSCSESSDPGARVYVYEEIDSCVTVITSVKDFLILQCSLNCIASGVCFWFVTLLWKAKYQNFHSGLRLYSRSGSGSTSHSSNQVSRRSKVPDQVPASPIIGIGTHGKPEYPIYDRHEHEHL